MTKKLTRRDFVRTGAAAGLALPPARSAVGRAPAVVAQKTSKPIVIASENGNVFKNGGSMTCVETAFSMMTKGSDVLDALIAGVNIPELDPEESSVGYGGVPNAEGVVQLDASCMHGPKKRAGAVASLEGVRTPSLVAKAVMENTDHQLLVGRGAQQFARVMGFRVEDDLNTERSRSIWLEWKRRTDPSHYLDPKKRAGSWRRAILDMVAAGRLSAAHLYGTINCNGVNSKGEICGVTTTSGLYFKIPGRVGDSPIIGAGLYVDNAVGVAGSTGRGEANLFALGSFLVVERMRAGDAPKDAAIAALKRLVANTVEKRLLNGRGKPNFNVSYYAVNARGNYAGVSLYAAGREPVNYAVCTDDGPKTLPMDGLLPGAPTD